MSPLFHHDGELKNGISFCLIDKFYSDNVFHKRLFHDLVKLISGDAPVAIDVVSLKYVLGRFETVSLREHLGVHRQEVLGLLKFQHYL